MNRDRIVIHNKLVRDKIPQIIENAGKEPVIKVLSDSEYEMELTKKLQEELNEFKEDNSIEELADLQEVINAILHYKNVTKDEFQSVIESKSNKRGAFNNRIYLESVLG